MTGNRGSFESVVSTYLQLFITLILERKGIYAFWRVIGLAFCVEANKNIQNHLAWRTKRLSRPIKTHNLDGLFNRVQGWSKYGKCPFINLKVEDELWEETYLAALLSCWLYTFVLPSEDLNTICPRTFNTASFMAPGYPVNRAIPVLASLY